ncbi:hypothetical protein DSO57_1021784 [Entomophthora muscae]|uniref:Uncharacterized protein n=1 Tax=Entomophthora muscae TaxID=34485 RepID=A0ACC2SG24_9FUNG|nr:hypothetical protein DSO57_1021784 [Entomophthora muscae]
MPNSERETNQTELKRRTRSQYAALESRTHQLESLLKAATKISDFVERVETLETNLKSCQCGSVPIKKRNICSFGVLNPSTHQGYCNLSSPEEIFGNREFLDILISESVSRMELLNSFLDDDASSGVLESPNFFTYTFYAVACLLAGSVMDHDLIALEKFSLNKAYSLLPDIKSKPSALHIKGLILLGIYESRLSRTFSSIRHIDSAFSMIQYMAASKVNMSLEGNFPESMTSCLVPTSDIPELQKLDSTWPIMLAFKQYSVILFGNASMLKGLESSIDNIQSAMNDGDSVSSNNLNDAINFGFIVKHCFNVALYVHQTDLKPTSQDFLDKLMNRKEIQEMEKRIGIWKGKKFPHVFRSYFTVVGWLEDRNAEARRADLADFLYLNFIRILIYWPTILVFCEPVEFPSTVMQTLLEIAGDVYHVLEIWDQHISYNRLQISLKLIPFSIRLPLMAAVVYLNVQYQFDSESPSFVSFSAKVAYIEEVLCRYRLIWEGSQITLEDLEKAKNVFKLKSKNSK